MTNRSNVGCRPTRTSVTCEWTIAVPPDTVPQTKPCAAEAAADAILTAAPAPRTRTPRDLLNARMVASGVDVHARVRSSLRLHKKGRAGQRVSHTRQSAD